MEAAKYLDVLISLSIVLMLLYGLAWSGKKLGLVERLTKNEKLQSSEKVVFSSQHKKSLLRFSILQKSTNKVDNETTQPAEKERSRVQTMILDAHHKLLSFELNGQPHAVVSGPAGMVVLENSYNRKNDGIAKISEANKSNENSSSIKPIGEVIASLVPPSWGGNFYTDNDDEDDIPSVPSSTTLQ